MSPIYEQLAAIITTKVDAGQLALGDRLPTELELARKYAISRETVRQALGMLERRGLVIRRRAKGTFIATPRVSQDLAELRSFHGGLLKQGVAPEMELLEFRPVKPPAELAGVFTQSEVVQLLRRYVVTRKPLAVADIYRRQLPEPSHRRSPGNHGTTRLRSGRFTVSASGTRVGDNPRFDVAKPRCRTSA